ncbi:ribosomal protein S18-alanine N-acetyltransferase [Arsenicicoccus dermatophilus]|uniref:ribosomal protein S18-alanine N-acetyltransferase n=1 Tax=Arsenicicoccus dermatophilus TaxID=1076331 RepID=UPI00391753BC
MLRELAWGDLPRLAELEREAFAQDAWSEPTWWSELAGRPRREYVVWDDPERGGVVGYAGLDHGGDVADVMTIAVTPVARGLGLGRRLLHELVARATAGGASALLLEVRADNAPARALYESHGFETISVRRRYYQPGDGDALVMRRHLAPGEPAQGRGATGAASGIRPDPQPTQKDT